MADLGKLAKQLISQGPHKVEKTRRRVRALFDGDYVFDVTDARHVWEHPYYPQYYVRTQSIKPSFLVKQQAVDESDAAFYARLTGPSRSTDRVLIFEKGDLAGLVRIEFDACDWFEEDVQIHQHPKDPYKRIDILPSTRKVTIKVDEIIVAESSSNMFLFETGLRPRYYMPKTKLRWNYVVESQTTTRCPYKGLAHYYSIKVPGGLAPDVIWWYQDPTSESAAIQGMICFYNEKVDVFVDDVKEQE